MRGSSLVGNGLSAVSGTLSPATSSISAGERSPSRRNPSSARRAVGLSLGIVLGDGLGCIDLDHCIVDGVVAEWAQGWIDGYREDAVLIERSFSGEGVHIFLPMEEGPGRRIRDGVQNVEVYSCDRYIAVTGDILY